MTIWQFLILLAEINGILVIVLSIYWARSQNRKASAEVAKNISTWKVMKDMPYMSQRFAFKRYLGWTNKDIDDHLSSS